MEAANNLWYAGFEGLDKDGKIIGWEHTNNIDIWAIETAPNFKTFTRSWNKKTSNWLNRYIYQRHKGNPWIVYIMSALWHGFYPGYYIAFISATLVSLCEKIGRRYISPLFGENILYRVFCAVMIHCIMTYCNMSFVLLTWTNSIDALKCQYFWGHLVMILFYLVCPLVLKKSSPH
jgi:hypothetical protein